MDPFLQQFAQQQSPPDAGTLLDFAKKNHFQVTSGFSHGSGHNKGSRHYQGSEKDPEAVDINHRGVSLSNLRKLADQDGYIVRDERTRPKGQEIWGGPHYHLEKSRGQGQKAQAAHQDPFLAQFSNTGHSSMPAIQSPAAINTTIDPKTGTIPLPARPASPNLTPIIQSALSNQAPALHIPSQPEAPSNNVAQNTMDLVDRQPVQQQAALNPLQNFLNTAINTGSAGILNLPTRPGISREIGSFVGPAVGTGAAILAAPETGFASLALPAGYMGISAAGNTAREQYNRTGRIDNPLAVGTSGLLNAGLGFLGPVGRSGAGMLERGLTNAAVQGSANVGLDIAQQAAEQGTLTPKLDTGRIGQSALVGGAVGGVFGALHKPKPVEAAPKPKELNIPEVSNVAAKPENLHTPVQTKELSQAWAERQRPAEVPQIIDPRNQPLPKELGNIKTETTDGGIILATKAGQREIPQVETASAPVGERVYPAKEMQTESIIDPQTGQPYKPQERPLQPSSEIGLRRAEERASRAEDVNTPEPTRLTDNPATDILDTAPSKTEPSLLLDASGKPATREVGNVSIERPGVPKPTDPSALELPKSYEKPQLREVGQVEPKAETPESPPGAYTDTINELLKDTGLDFAGVQKLKTDIDTRKSLLETTLKSSRTDEAKRLRTELKEMTAQFKTLDPNIQEIASQQFDPQTGMAQQRPLDKNSQFTLDQVRGSITPQTLPIAEQINQALQNGTKVRLKYVAEQSGRSREVAKLSRGGRAVVQTTEFSPTHFGYTNATFAGGKKQMPVVHGYNQRGHEVMYYLDKSPKGSHVQQVVSVTDKPAFQGPVSNIHKGPGQYNVTDILSRGARTERGLVKTSDAIKAIHEQKLAMREVSNNAILPVEEKQRFEKMYSGRDLSYDEVKSMLKDLSKPEKIAQFCKNLGLS
jgi:hypothetical protein